MLSTTVADFPCSDHPSGAPLDLRLSFGFLMGNGSTAEAHAQDEWTGRWSSGQETDGSEAKSRTLGSAACYAVHSAWHVAGAQHAVCPGSVKGSDNGH